jgi:hypothetical protein
VALFACSPSQDSGSDRHKLIGSYKLVLAGNQKILRKNFVSSELKLSPNGMFTQQCRYTNGKADSAIGSWSYSNRRAQFSVFKDCAGVWPAGARNRNASASLTVDFTSPTRIVLSPEVNARYERHGAR